MLQTQPTVKIEDDQIAYSELNGTDTFNKTIRCTYFLVVLFKNGSGVHSIDGNEYPIGERQLHFLFPGQHHHWEAGPETEAQKVTIGRKVFETFSSTEIFHLIRHNLHPVFKLDAGSFASVSRELDAIDVELRSPDNHVIWKEILSARMSILTMMIGRQAETYINGTVLKSARPLVRDYWALIHQHFTKEKRVSWYAAQLGVSANYLNIICKKHLNITAKQIVEQRILQEAKQQLRSTEKSIKEITYALGFKDMPAFTKYFKEKSGFSPSEYRQ